MEYNYCLILLFLSPLVIIIYYFYILEQQGLRTMCHHKKFCIKVYDKTSLIYIKELFDFYDQLLLAMPRKDVRTKKLEERFNKNRIFEVNPNNSNNWTSYTIDKGRQMGLCLKNKYNDYHNLNTLKFVFLHELGHVVSDTFHHDLNFWENFKFLLNIAYRNNLVDVVDYQNYNTPYCGIIIDYNPYLDSEL